MATKKKNSDQDKKPQNAYFLSLELENVRCFGEKQKIDFSDGKVNPKQWTIILGDNGTGKTTILQGLIAMIPYIDWLQTDEDVYQDFSMPVVGLPAHITNLWKPFRSNSKSATKIESLFSTSKNLKENKRSLSFILSASNQGSRSTRMNYWSTSSVSEMLAVSRCFGYGAARKIGETSISEQSEETAYITLFDETVLLLNPEEWFLRVNYAKNFYESDESRSLSLSLTNKTKREKRRKEIEIVNNILMTILPNVDDIRFNEKDIPNKRTPQPIVEFKTPYGWVEAKDLSLGYRTSMAWMVDFASRMFDLYPESENPLAEPAVVLIDEIDLHLHPKWQRDLLDWLSNLFPNTQFIVTTHSPLIVQSAAARDANFAVCRREGDHVVIDQSLDAVRGWRADQILTSDLFGLESARDVEIEKLEKEQRQILSKAKLTKAQEQRAKEIAEKLSSLRVMENPEDDKAMEIIRRAAKSLQKNGSK